MSTNYEDCYGDFVGIMKKDRRTLINNVASHLQLDVEQTKRLHSKFLDNQEEFEEKHFEEPIQLNETIREELSHDKSQRTSRSARLRNEKSKQKKLSSYNRYMQEQMLLLKQNNPSINQKEAFKIIASQWKKHNSENTLSENQNTSNSEQENMVLTKIRYSGNETFLLDKESGVVYTTDTSNGKLFSVGEYNKNTKEIIFYN